MIKTVMLVLIAEIFAAAAQILFKKSTNSLRSYELYKIEGHAAFIQDVLSDRKIWLGLLAMTASMVVWLLALAGAELSLVFSLGSMQYILIMITAHFFLGEKIDMSKLTGTLLVVIGIVFVALSR